MQLVDKTWVNSWLVPLPPGSSIATVEVVQGLRIGSFNFFFFFFLVCSFFMASTYRMIATPIYMDPHPPVKADPCYR